MKDFFEDPAELSSDLEWMLQSGQVGREVLAEALIGEYYAPIYRLALALLNDEDLAQEAALHTFRSALEKLERYRSSQGVRPWLFHQALESVRAVRRRAALKRFLKRAAGKAREPDNEARGVGQVTDPFIWAAFDRMEPSINLTVVLRCLFDWEAQEIARLLKRGEAQVEAWLEEARGTFRTATERSASPRAYLSEEEVWRKARQALQDRWPNTQFTPGELRWAAEAVLRDLERAGGSRRLNLPVGEYFWLGVFALLIIGLIWGSTRFMAEPEPSPTPVPPRARTQGAKATEPPQPTRTPQPATPTPEPSPTASVRMLYVPRQGESLRSIAEKLDISSEQLAAFNQSLGLEEDVPPDRAVMVPLSPERGGITPTPVPRPDVRLDLLSESASSNEIYTFLLLSERLWRSLWADGEMIDYGPAGFIGRPLAAHQQTWVSQPGQSRSLIGPSIGQPQELRIITGGWFYFFQPGSRDGYMRETNALIPDTALLQELIFPGRAGWIQEVGRFEPVEEVEHTGRPSLVVDWYNARNLRERRLWVDRERGLILRLERYSPLDGRTLVQTVELSQVLFDKALPPEFFDPTQDWNAEFASNFLGGSPRDNGRRQSPVFEPLPGHEPLELRTPPPDFDPSSSQLAFQYPGSASVETTPAANPPRVELFADGYFLGRVTFGRPWGLVCDRSPDGMKIAFAARNHWLEFSSRAETSLLKWFSLDDLNQVRTPPLSIEPTDFAFSPDSQRLAVFGYGPNGSHLYLLDLESGDVESRIELDIATSLIWSPDGEYLAFLGSREWPRMAAMVMHVLSARIIYDTTVDYNPFNIVNVQLEPGWPAFSWPVHNWGVEFPVRDRSLANCIEPPEPIVPTP